MKHAYLLVTLLLTLPLVAQGNEPLTLTQAEEFALKNNPNVTIAKLVSLAEGQVVREVRSAELPVLNGNITAVTANDGSRLAAGALNNPIVYNRAAAGITLSQTITDFGRTQNLVHAASLAAQAQQNNAKATSQEIRLAVDDAFYRALSAHAILRVADQTVRTRQSDADQITALAGAKLKSTLDQSFAEVSLSQAKMLQLDARNGFSSALNRLNALMGRESGFTYDLVDETPEAPSLPPNDAEPLITEAFRARPELLSAVEQAVAAEQSSKAEHKLQLPTLSALGGVGSIPVRADQINSSWYGAIGVNLSIPLFNGFLDSARAQEADLRSEAASQQVLLIRQLIARDVRQTVLAAQVNFQRINVSKELLDQANTSFDLAQTRYKLGLSSIVELSQAQLAQTQAQIDYATARYNYQLSVSELRFQTGQ